MPSAEHESPIALAKLDPGVLAWLLSTIFDIKVPSYHHARPHATDTRVLVPRTFHADGVLLFCDPRDHPLLAVVLEVQLSRVRSKWRRWKLYVAQLEAEFDVGTALVVYCPDKAVAAWYRDMAAADGPSLILRPLIFTPTDVPLVMDTNLARINPALVVLAAICHGHHDQVDAMFPALVAALQATPTTKTILYNDIVLAGLSETARTRWEAFVSTTLGHQYLSERFRELVAEGEARGEGQAVLTVLDARGVAVPDAVRERILACTDLDQLNTWVRRAATANTVEDVVGG